MPSLPLLSRFIVCCLVASALAAPPAFAMAEGELPFNLTSRAPIERMRGQLQTVARTRDARLLATLIRFPFVVRDGCKLVTLRNQKDVITHFNWMMSRGVRERLVDLAAADMDAFPDGVAIWSGKLWMEATGRDRLQLVARWTIRHDSEGIEAGETCVQFACSTRTYWHRVLQSSRGIVLESGRKGSSRVRTRLGGGTERREGSGQCAYAMWLFRTPKHRVLVSEMGCGVTAGSYDLLPLLTPEEESEELTPGVDALARYRCIPSRP